MRRNLRMLVAAALMSFLLQPAFAVEPPPEAIAAKMAGVTDELHRNQIGKPVQTEQNAIVRDLDALIASLEKQCENNGKGMKSNNPNRGLKDSVISSGTGGMGTLVNPAENGKDWAKLSGRERDRILQSMTEGFPSRVPHGPRTLLSPPGGREEAATGHGRSDRGKGKRGGRSES